MTLQLECDTDITVFVTVLSFHIEICIFLEWIYVTASTFQTQSPIFFTFYKQTKIWKKIRQLSNLLKRIMTMRQVIRFLFLWTDFTFFFHKLFKTCFTMFDFLEKNNIWRAFFFMKLDDSCISTNRKFESR